MFPPSVWSLAGRQIEGPPRRRIGAWAPAGRPATTAEQPAMTIRRARPDEGSRLADLAALDSSRPLRGEDIFVAEVAGTAIAALDVFTGRSVADPLTPSAAAVDLLRVRAEQLRAADRPAPRRRHQPLAAMAGLRR